MESEARIDYQTNPSEYRHWKLSFDGPLARLELAVDESGGVRPGYTLKLNSYDLGVDIELHDALNRVRFEHPEVRTVIVGSARERVFCSGANIFMLASSPHEWKVNFCKFTNETRNGIEDASQHSGLKFLAAINGTCAGGGYELALACDELVLVDDRSSAVSLPEVPLLGVLPGTGGLTRLTDKRKVRHDLADVFCTTAEGVRGRKAVEWRLVDALARPAEFDERVSARALALAESSDRPRQATGISLTPLERTIEEDRLGYPLVDVEIDRTGRTATFTVRGPEADAARDLEAIHAQGAAWYPLALARQLDDAILSMRTNELEIGTWIIKTEGSADFALALDDALAAHAADWFVRETTGALRRTLARLDVTSRTLFALVERDSCFAGTLLELALACDRIYHLALPDDPDGAPRIAVGKLNFGAYPMVDGQARLARRFYGEREVLDSLQADMGRAMEADEAFARGLATLNPDDLDWDDEIRIALEERAAMSPDALTGMEANLRFGGPETLFTRVFARLSAWQNWIFQRPNAVGPHGTLRSYGSGQRVELDRRRV